MARYRHYRTVWGENVARRRLDLGLTQHDLARLAGITQQTVSSIETGARAPSDTHKALIANALEYRPDDTDVLFPAASVWRDLIELADATAGAATQTGGGVHVTRP